MVPALVIGVLANFAFALVLLLPALKPAVSLVVVVGDIVLAGAFAAASRGDPLVILAVVGALLFSGALVLNADDPVVASYAGIGAAPAVLYRLERPIPGGLGLVDDWIVAAGVQRLPLAGGGPAATGPGTLPETSPRPRPIPIAGRFMP